MRKIGVLLSVVFLVLTACQSRPDYVIGEETMTNLLTDVHMAEGLIDVQQSHNKEQDNYGQQIMASVLTKYNISKAQYDTSLVWYSQNLQSLIRIYRHVNENLDSREQEWKLQAESSSEFGMMPSGDSVNFWMQSPYVVMDESILGHYRVWTIPADTTFYTGDTIQWTFHVNAMSEGVSLIASISILKSESSSNAITVLDGATTPNLSVDTMMTLTCVAPKDTEIKQIVAVLGLQGTDSVTTQLKPCLVDKVQMIRLHCKK